jgi:hypothetical protein
MGIIKFSTVDEMGVDQVGSYLFQQDSAVYDLDFRSNWPEFFFSTIAMKSQQSFLTQSDFYWPMAIGPVLKLQTGIGIYMMYHSKKNIIHLITR